jgi:hypothetical protein
MQLGKFIKALSLIVGTVLALFGLLGLYIAASGAATVGTPGMYAFGGAFLVAAAPFLAFPFSVRVGRALGFAVLFAFAAAALWVAFGTSLATPGRWKFQVAATAFAGLVLFRVWLAWRGKRPRLGT